MLIAEEKETVFDVFDLMLGSLKLRTLQIEVEKALVGEYDMTTNGGATPGSRICGI